MAEDAASVTIIMPVFDGARTLARSIGSVLAQSVSDWNLVIVIDGSTDNSAEVALAAAAGEPRIRVVRQNEQRGPAAARNRGLAEARSTWVAFLDDDDTLSRDFLARMLTGLNGDVDVAVTGFVRLNESGEEIGRAAAPPIDDDPVGCCLNGPPAAIHCFVARRDLVERVGGFDVGLRIGEDWDLWLRLAQAGARFRSVAGYYAQYRSEGQSLTADGEAMLRDFDKVLNKAVRSGAAESFDAQAAADQLLASLFWSAGNAIGRGVSAVPLVATVADNADWRFQPLALASRFIDGLAVGSRRPWSHQVFSMHLYAPMLEELFATLEQRLGERFNSFAILQAIEAELLRAGHYSSPIRLRHAAGLPLGLRRLSTGLNEQPFPDLLLLRLPRLRPTPLFTFSMPMLTPLTGRDLLRQVWRSSWRRLESRIDESTRGFAVAVRLRRLWRIALRMTGRSERSGGKIPVALSRLLTEQQTAARQTDIVRAVPTMPVIKQAPEHPATGASQAEWETFFSHEDPWDYGNLYEQVKYDRTIEMITDDDAPRARHALEIACAEGRFTAQLAPLCDRVTAIDISQTALDRAARRNAGIPTIDYMQRDVFRDGVEGRYDLVTCSEVLYYMPDRPALDRLAEQVAAALEPGGRFVHAHAYQLIDTPGRTAFDWEDSFGAQTIFEAFRGTAGLLHRRTIESDCYRIDLFEKASSGAATPRTEVRPLGAALTDSVESSLVWNGAVRTQAELREQRVFRVPVLMYHRIAAEGPATLAQYRIDPNRFERQMRYLRRRGFHSLSLDEWDRGARLGGSLKGRPIVISFDDAYVDFADTAWPILKRHGFGALMFVPTGHVGGAARWDAAAGAPAPIMGWDRLAALAGEGLEIGSHLVSHSVSSLLSARSLFDEAVESRVALEAMIGAPVTSVAPPFGVTDARIEGVLEAAGYNRLFRAEGQAAPVLGMDMRLPRIGVYADMDDAEFAAAVGTTLEPFADQDTP